MLDSEVKELLDQLLILPTDLNAIEKLLQKKQYSKEVLSKAGFAFADACWEQTTNYEEEHFYELNSEPLKRISNLCSTYMPQIFELLLRYGLDPNENDGEDSLMCKVSFVCNEYVAADTLALLFDYGADPFMCVGGENLFDQIDFDVIFDSVNQEVRGRYDSLVHCWFVLLGYFGNQYKDKEVVTVFSDNNYFENIKEFEINDLKQHRDFYFGLSKTPWRGENWSLHIFSRKTFWEVARL